MTAPHLGGQLGAKAVPAQTTLDFAKQPHKVTSPQHKTVPDMEIQSITSPWTQGNTRKNVLPSATFPAATSARLEHPFLSSISAYQKKHTLFGLGRCWRCQNLLELQAPRGWEGEGAVREH